MTPKTTDQYVRACIFEGLYAQVHRQAAQSLPSLLHTKSVAKLSFPPPAVLSPPSLSFLHLLNLSYTTQSTST